MCAEVATGTLPADKGEERFGIMHHFEGGTQEQYETSLKVVHPASGWLPGRTLHVGAETADGFLVIALSDTDDSWVKFCGDTLMPGLATTESGFGAPPEETPFKVVSVQTT
jgi:hypothetical protein